MKIQPHALVSIHIKMYDAQGDLLEQSSQPLTYLHGHDDIFPRVEAALEGKAVGDALTVHLEPEEAFGDYDPELVLLVPLEALGEGAVVGAQVAGEPEQENASAQDEQAGQRVFTVTDIADGKAVLDGNHPLAGVALRLEVEVAEVRPASSEELEQAELAQVPEFVSVLAPDGKSYH